MGQKRPRKGDKPTEKSPKLKYPPYNEKKHGRPNLELMHDKEIAKAVAYTQTALTIFVLGATIAYFLYNILQEVELVIFGLEIAGIRVYISIFIFFIFVFLGGKRSFYSQQHFIRAQFIEKILCCPHTWDKYKLHNRLEKFREWDEYYDKRTKKFKRRRRRRYFIKLDEIYLWVDKKTVHILDKLLEMWNKIIWPDIIYTWALITTIFILDKLSEIWDKINKWFKRSLISGFS